MHLKITILGVALSACCGLAGAQMDPSIITGGRVARMPDPLEAYSRELAIRNSLMQGQQTAAQTRQIEEQTKALQLENQRRQESRGAGGQSTQAPSEIDPAMQEWLRAAGPRMHLYPDFEQVVFSDELTISTDMIRLMSGSPLAADLAYYFGKHRTEALAVAQMTLLDAARTVDRIEKQLKPSAPRSP